MIIYNSTTHTVQKYENGTWADVSSAASPDFSGDVTVAGYLRVGSNSAPASTADGDLTAQRLNIGNQSFSASNGRIVSITGTMTDTASGAAAGSLFLNTVSPASNSSTDIRSATIQTKLDSGTGITIASVTSAHIENRIGANQDGAITAMTGAIMNGVTLDSGANAAVSVGTLIAIQGRPYGRASGSSALTATTTVAFDSVQTTGGSGFTTTDFHSSANW
jgi:hypothetical protein